MDLNNASVSCNLTIEWQNAQAVVIRKISNKFGTLRIIRNDLHELFIVVNIDKQPSPIRLKIKSIRAHKKFMLEGKASITFADEKCTIFLSNAPPGILVQFLKTLFIKLTSENAAGKDDAMIQKNIRAHMLSGKPSQFEEISPITNAELARAKKLAISNSTVTTPSPPQSKKRRIASENENARCQPKKLYTPSPLASTIAEQQKLNEEQETILQTCLSGKNIFFTGSAGTGKSFLLRKIISTLQPEGTVATASTGVAACLIGGVTLHSFAGIGGGDAPLQRCYDLASRGVVAQTWRKCKRLIIDEISMVDGEYFEKIEAVARFIRRNDKPFGGIQLILCGDFLQLPPVIKLNRSMSQQQGQESVKRFCFQSPAWQKCIERSYELQKVHRQKDSKFVEILNHIRIGRVTDDITSRLLATSNQKIEQDGILATQLCSHTNDADLINQSKLNNLTGEEKTFDASDENCDSFMSKQLDQQVPAPGKLVLKIGAQVMLLKNVNISIGLVNGARGVVLKYVDGYPLVKFKSNREYLAKPEKWIIKTASGGTVARRQVPLKLAWAFSIHKSQGLTLDCVEMSLSKVFEAGQAYVALSRAQSLDSLRVLDFDAKQVWANPDVLQYYRVFRRQLLNLSVIPLGPAARKADNNKLLLKKSLSDLKLKKSLMGKPLVNIN